MYVNPTRNPAETDVAIGTRSRTSRSSSTRTRWRARQNDNFPVWRYAEALLNYAEVLNELGGRRRHTLHQSGAGTRRPLGAPAVCPKRRFRDAVFKEERVELAFENKRWFQLVRTGRAVAIMNAHRCGAEGRTRIGRRDPGTYT
jgi:hypothetical protein